VLRVRQDRLDDAVVDLKKAAELKPNEYQAHVNLAQAYHRQKKADLALAEMNQAVSWSRSPPTSTAWRARLYLERKEPALALSDFDQAIRRESPSSPYLADDHAERGKLLTAERKHAEALSSFDAALRCNLEHLRGQRLRADCLFSLGRHEESLKAFDAYLENDQAHLKKDRALESVYRGRGLVRAELGKYPAAIEDYTRALEIRATSEVQASRGWAFVVCDAPKLALRDFELAIKLDEKNADAYNGRGFVLAGQGKAREAVADAKTAVRLGPRTPRLLYNAARVHAQCGEHDRALELVRQSLDLVPEEERAAFWSAYVKKDVAMQAVRRLAAYRQLEAEGGEEGGAEALMRQTARSWYDALFRRRPATRHADRRRFVLERLEDRSLPSASPLDLAVPLHFDAFGQGQVAHVSNFLSSPSEVDLYKVVLQPSDVIAASVRARQDGSGLASLLRVFDGNGVPLALNDLVGGDPSLRFQASMAGTYYVGVSSAPNDDYDPTIVNDTAPGATTGLYALDVRLTTAAPLQPDLTGSAFRLGREAASAGEAVPLSFVVDNRGGADAGAFRVEILLSPDNLFGPTSSVVLATLRRDQLVSRAGGRSFASPAGFSVTLPAFASGRAFVGLRLVPGGVPESDASNNAAVHNGTDWAPLTVTTTVPPGVTNLSQADASLNAAVNGGLAAAEVDVFSFTVSDTLGDGRFTRRGAHHRRQPRPPPDALRPRRPTPHSVRRRPHRAAPDAGDVRAGRLGPLRAGRLSPGHDLHRRNSPRRARGHRRGRLFGGRRRFRQRLATSTSSPPTGSPSR